MKGLDEDGHDVLTKLLALVYRYTLVITLTVTQQQFKKRRYENWIRNKSFTIL